MPSVSFGYHAASLVTCIGWWTESRHSINEILEKDKCCINLSDWLIQEQSSVTDLRYFSKIGRTFGKDWLRHKKLLIPSRSPLRKIEGCLQCKWGQWNIDARIKAGFYRFKDWLVHGQYPAFEYVSSKIRGIPISQYNQIKSLIDKLIEIQL